MKLQQNQLWQQGNHYYRILKLERLEVEYRELKGEAHTSDSVASSKYGKNHTVSKKEFCRLIRNAKLVEG